MLILKRGQGWSLFGPFSGVIKITMGGHSAGNDPAFVPQSLGLSALSMAPSPGGLVRGSPTEVTWYTGVAPIVSGRQTVGGLSSGVDLLEGFSY